VAKSLFISLVFFFSTNSFAGESLLPDKAIKKSLMATLASDQDDKTSKLYVLVDDKSAIQEFQFESTEGRSIFTLKQVSSRDGVVLLNDQGYDAILLKGTISNELGKGEAVIKYLTNAWTSHYNSCPIKIERNKESQWKIINAHTAQSVEKLIIKVSTMGIKTIEGICN
jgi:hypothetical protein